MHKIDKHSQYSKFVKLKLMRIDRTTNVDCACTNRTCFSQFRQTCRSLDQLFVNPFQHDGDVYHSYARVRRACRTLRSGTTEPTV